jgi:hypothetical protein
VQDHRGDMPARLRLVELLQLQSTAAGGIIQCEEISERGFFSDVLEVATLPDRWLWVSVST